MLKEYETTIKFQIKNIILSICDNIIKFGKNPLISNFNKVFVPIITMILLLTLIPNNIFSIISNIFIFVFSCFYIMWYLSVYIHKKLLNDIIKEHSDNCK